jgi:deoxyribodipyrimidine photo-lyase
LTAYDASLFWFRRDLRDEDNAGLYYALTSSQRVYCAFIFDREILDRLPARADRRVQFIWESVRELKQALRSRGGDLVILHERATEAIPALARRLGAQAVFANGDYEPAAVARDARVEAALAADGRRFHRAKDHVVFEKDEVLTQAGGRFVVFTPYRNAWLKKVDEFFLKAYPVARHAQRLAAPPFACEIPALEALGFARTDLAAIPVHAGMSGARGLFADFLSRIGDYKALRDFPGEKAVSFLSVHNRFGTISIRELARHAWTRRGEGAATWLAELIWRDFYFQILWHNPHAANSAFRPEYDALAWPNDERLFRAWCDARTGFPIVDAAMRQLSQTGYMHNRLRMIVASFLVKDLLVDWRWGEKHFADNLIDFDLAANNGGWQWAASTGCDAQPYFRIFNPVSQSERFDPRGVFVRRYVPELARVGDRFIHAPWTMGREQQQACGCVIGRDYPAPVVDHAMQREKALSLYKAVKLSARA